VIFRRRGGPEPSAPVLEGDFPDPQVLVTGDGYVAFATNAGGSNVQVATSPDLRTWTRRADALPDLPGWAQGGFTWSPAALAAVGGYRLWYVVRDPGSGRQVISVAAAERPEGPYVDRSPGPAIAQLDQGGSIDPSPFVAGDGTAYLLWKADANAIGRPSTLWGQQLDPSGDRLVGEPVQLLAHDRPWEQPLVEAPCIAGDGDRLWLLYSGGWWESDGYGVGYAAGGHPLGPWSKQTTRRPWLRSGGAAAGPGGQEAFRGLDGGWYLAYHAWTPGRVGYPGGGARSLRVGRLDLSGDTPGLTPLDT
jgi:beta-xylosidase